MAIKDSPARPARRRGVRGAFADFYRKAYEDNLTGLSAMVAYNLLLSVFPLALLALFIAGRILRSADLENSVLQDLRHLFPSTAEHTLADLLARVRNSSTGLGIVALVTSIWIGSSFWGALDTAFCRIYHVRCRSWVEQKRFALAMLVVVLLFMAATVAVPTLQSILVGGAKNLPFGLKNVHDLIYAVSLAAGLAILFAVVAAVAGPAWFERDKAGFDDPALEPSILGLLTIILVPVQLLLVAFAMRGFQQQWSTEIEVRRDEADRYGPDARGGEPQPA